MDSSKFPSLDNQLFTWKSWADEGPLSMQFNEVTLKVAVGEYPVGTQFPAAFILGDMSLLVLIDEDQEEHGFRLNLTVGEKVDPSELKHDHADGCGCGHEH
jgi:hypothetical protein